MADRVAVVMGASLGIGEGTARALCRAGYAVSLAARREDRINALCDELTADGGRILSVPTDVSDPDSARSLIQTTKDEFGRVDVLINNAGVMLLGPILGAELEHWQRMGHGNRPGPLY